jgi:hypothetical protein
VTSENVEFWSRHAMSEDLQLPRWLGLGRVVCPRALSISAALSGVTVAILGIGTVPRRDDGVQDVRGGLDAQGLEEKKGEYDQRT